jgi:hypothetical protein
MTVLSHEIPFQRCHPESRQGVTKDLLTVYTQEILRRFAPQNDSAEP